MNQNQENLLPSEATPQECVLFNLADFVYATYHPINGWTDTPNYEEAKRFHNQRVAKRVLNQHYYSKDWQCFPNIG